ncbi:MAG: ATP-binding protein [Bacteroidota bacterium]
MITPADLQSIQVFEDLDATALAWLQEHMEPLSLDTGDPLTKSGDPAEWMYVIFEGQIRFEARQENGTLAVFMTEAGQVSGMLPHSRMTIFRAASAATMPTRLARLHKRHFEAMLEAIPPLESRFAHIMLDRTRANAHVQVQQEKLAALGTMAAGLAHELNNPASAAKRAAQQMVETLKMFNALSSGMLQPIMFKDSAGTGHPFQPVIDVIEGESPSHDALTASELEDDLADFLDEHDLPASWDAAAMLVSMGFTRDFLVSFSEALHEDQVSSFLSWLTQSCEMRMLSSELALSTTRISELVQAMKSYSYMDKANEKSETDIHEGINNTLTILNHKLRGKAIDVVKEYGDIPVVEAYGGELNQVWTNLLDNAIAAVPESNGRITIRSRYQPTLKSIEIEVVDNGAGIPDTIKDRIFEPFFTTKDTGEGTGLGLDISYRIVTARHGGALSFISEPGETCFQVRLPVS